MNQNPVLALAEQQEWLQPIQNKGEELVKGAFESAGRNGAALKNLLHGVGLGHPLHAAVTDIPVGSWTAALVLDLLDASGRSEYRAGADAAVAVGLAGAVGAALSGLTDWSETHGKPQRVGALHGLINGAATLLYTGSYLFRKSGNQRAGRALGFLSYGLIFAGAFLGGELAYSQRIGVDHAPDPEELPQEFTRACAESDLPEGRPQKITLGGTDLFLLREDGRICGMANKCSHLGGPLSEGEIGNGTVRCPWHGSEFSLADGSVRNGPATHAQPPLDVQVRNGEAWVKART